MCIVRLYEVCCNIYIFLQLYVENDFAIVFAQVSFINLVGLQLMIILFVDDFLLIV